MKMMITSAALIAAMSTTAAYANGDWENSTVEVQMISGPLDFSIAGNEDNVGNLEVGYTAFEYTMGAVDANVRFAVSTDMSAADNMTLTTQYNVSTMIVSDLLAYGTAELAYATDTSFSTSDWTVEPSAGILFAFHDSAAVYGEVGYTWSVDDNFDAVGGYVEVGLPISLSESVMLTPSVAQTFDTGSDAANAKVEVSFNF
jgi:hypothetical protein